MVTARMINDALAQLWPETGVRCIEVDENGAVASLEPPSSSLRPGGYIDGPTQFGVADAALWFATHGAIGRIEPMALTSELSVRFLRPAVGTKIFARAKIDRAGRRSVVGTITVWTEGNEGRPCSTAQGTYMLPEPPAR